MQQDYEQTLAFSQKSLKSKLKVEAWQLFLNNWASENPFSDLDDKLRQDADSLITYWINSNTIDPAKSLSPTKY